MTDMLPCTNCLPACLPACLSACLAIGSLAGQELLLFSQLACSAHHPASCQLRRCAVSASPAVSLALLTPSCL